MGCKECVHIDLCKKYHNHFAYDILPSVGCDDFKSKKPVTNADRFRSMSDEEQQKCVRRFWEIEDFADWLQQPAEGD